MAIINDRIRDRRIELGLTLNDVAAYLHVTEATAQRYESGAIRGIAHESIIKLAEILRCTPNYLMGFDDDFDHNEKMMINKYRALDIPGKEMVDTTLDLQYKRVTETKIIPLREEPVHYNTLAAHEKEDASIEEKQSDISNMKKRIEERNEQLRESKTDL